MKAFLSFILAAALVACSTSPGGGSTTAAASGAETSTGTGGVAATTTGGNALTTGGAPATTGGSSTGTSGGTGGQCQTSWPPRDCLAIAVCECADGTDQDFGCLGPPTCGDACCSHGGPFTDAGLDDAGMCQTVWPVRSCDAIGICTCGDGTEQEFGCIGPPTCSDACCGHDGPGTKPPPLPDAGVCQTWPPQICDAIFLCHCDDGMTEEAGCNGPPTCTAACCGHDGPALDGGASDGGVCQTTWPVRACLAEALCQCGDGTTEEFGCIGPPTCDDACCGHRGPETDGGAVSTPDAGNKDAGVDAGVDAGPVDAGPVEIPGDAGLTIDGGECPTYPPLGCGAIRSCTCGDGTTAEAGCNGPPSCNDACCGHDGSSED